jgi:DNA-binding HxlR family transcriptional regulator
MRNSVTTLGSLIANRPKKCCPNKKEATRRKEQLLKALIETPKSRDELQRAVGEVEPTAISALLQRAKRLGFVKRAGKKKIRGGISAVIVWKLTPKGQEAMALKIEW